MHHGRDPDEPVLAEMFRNVTVEEYGGKRMFGATGNFPGGKIAPTDEGEILLGVAHRDGKVVLDFGTPVAWIGMSPDQADEIADLLKFRARQARTQTQVSTG